jgi:ABC-type multidrug transport system fused ATPase/permease subunit
MPVQIDVVFWTLIIYLVIRYINTSSGRFLILLGIVAGLSLLNKYLIGILLLSLVLVIPFTQYRKVFQTRNFLVGILAGMIIFLPNLVWQFAHKLPVINHLSELERTQLAHVDRVSFLLDQIIMATFASVLTIAGLFYLFINKNAAKFRFLGIACIMVISFLFILRGKGYYTIGVFPFLIAAGAVSYERKLKNLWFKVSLPALLILLTIPLLPIGLPVFKSQGLVTYFRNLELRYGIEIGRKFEDGSIHSLPQDYADMLGWEELTSLTDKAYQMIEDKKSGFIYCENYGQAGAISIIGKKYGLPEAVSFNESFRYWIPEKFNPDITSLIYINDELGEDIQRLFNKITLIGKISNPDAREFGTAVYLCEYPKISFNEFWKRRLEILKQSNSL